MTLEQLSYVLEISKTRSINKAARNLFISQSAISIAVQNLEKELGQPIFSRTNQGVLPTPFGRSFIRYISPIMAQIQQIDNIFLRGRQRYSMSFTVANDGFHFVSEIFAKMFNKYKYLGVSMQQLDSYGDESRSLVANGVAEIGVIRLWNCYKKIERHQFKAMGLIYHQLFETGLAVMVGPNNNLYHEELEYITPDILEPYPMIKYGYLESGPFKDVIDRIGLHYSNSTIITSSRAVIEEMIMNTDAYFLTADLSTVYKDIGFLNSMRFLPLRGTDVRAELGWVSKRESNLSPIAIEFVNLLEQWFI
jgi:DNA-binding transcriptional LysR family regulator